MDLARAVLGWTERSYAALLGLGFFALRAAAVGERGPFVDESFYSLVPRFEVGYVHYLTGSPRVWPPLAAAAWELGGVEAARLVTASALAGVVALVALLAERACPEDLSRGARRGAGALAALLFATSAPALYLSVIATYDALALLLATTGLWLFVLGVDEDRRPLWWIAGLLVALAGVTRYRYLAFGAELFPFVLAFAWRRRRLRALVHVGVPAVAGVATYLLVHGEHVRHALESSALRSSACCRVEPSVLAHTLALTLAVPLAACALGLALAIARDLWRRRRGEPPAALREWAIPAALLAATLPAIAYHVGTASHFTWEKNAVLPTLGLALASGCLTGIALRAPEWRRRWTGLTLGVGALLALVGLAGNPLVAGPLSDPLAAASPALRRDWSDLRPVSHRLARRVMQRRVAGADTVWCLDASNPWELRRGVGLRVYDGHAWSTDDPTQIIAAAREAGAPLAVGFLAEPRAVGQVVQGYRVLDVLELDRSERGPYYVLALEPAAE